MGLFDKLKEKVSEATGIDVDSVAETTGQIAETAQNVADTAESVRDTKDLLTGKE